MEPDDRRLRRHGRNRRPLHRAEGGKRAAEIGYTLAAEFHGKGFASEAVDALLRWLFESLEVTRVGAELHPENLRSAQLLERSGFLFEGETRDSFWVGDELSNNWFYGLTRADWDEWQARPTKPPANVELVEITPSNQRVVRGLAVHHSQKRLVDSVEASMADTVLPYVVEGAPWVPWMRAVEADGEPAGFVMLALVTDAHPEAFLWRLLVDRRHQRRGIGRQVVEAICKDLASQGQTSLLTSWVEGEGSPRRFYEALGFVPTGKVEHGETEGWLGSLT